MYVYINIDIHVNIYLQKDKSICYPHSTDSYHAHPDGHGLWNMEFNNTQKEHETTSHQCQGTHSRPSFVNGMMSLGRTKTVRVRSLGSHEMLLKSPKTTGGIGDSSSLLTCMYKQLCPCWKLNPCCLNHEKPPESTLPTDFFCLGTKGPNTKYVWVSFQLPKGQGSKIKDGQTPRHQSFSWEVVFWFQKIICLTFLSKPTCSHTSSQASSLPI